MSDPMRVGEMSGALLISDESGRILFANPRIEALSGYGIAETIGAKPGELWGGRMPAGFYQDMWKVVAGQSRPFSSIVENRTKSGRVWTSLLSMAPIGPVGKRYYVAMQPEPGAWSDFRSRFSAEVAVGSADAQAFAAWMAHWLGASPDAWSASVGSRTTYDWLHDLFVQPMQVRFQDREQDRLLILEARKDGHSFGSVYEKYWPDIRGYFRRHLQDATEAEDLAQDVFVRAFASLDRYETRNATYRTFLLRIAHHVLLNRARVRSTIPLDEMAEWPSSSPAPDVLADRRVLLDRIGDALRKNEQELVEAFYLEGRSVKEIAERFHKSENAVKLSLSRVRKRLRKIG